MVSFKSRKVYLGTKKKKKERRKLSKTENIWMMIQNWEGKKKTTNPTPNKKISFLQNAKLKKKKKKIQNIPLVEKSLLKYQILN